MGRRALRCAPLLPAVVLLAACGQQAVAGSPPSGADDLVVQVEEVGGYVRLSSLATRLPVVSVYGDGRVLTEVPPPEDAVYPLPALGVVQERRIGADAVAALVERARDAGVGDDLDPGEPMVTDMSTTRFVVVTDQGRAELDAYALLWGSAEELTPDQRAVRAALTDLRAAVTDLPGTLGAAAVSAPEPYRPSAVAAVVEPWTDPGPGYATAEVPWPGPDLPGEPLAAGPDVSCLTVTGPQVDAVLVAAATASAATPWVSGGERWTVAVRPLLPDESGCEDLQLGW